MTDLLSILTLRGSIPDKIAGLAVWALWLIALCFTTKAIMV